jgi:hypothetical protein
MPAQVTAVLVLPAASGAGEPRCLSRRHSGGRKGGCGLKPRSGRVPSGFQLLLGGIIPWCWGRKETGLACKSPLPKSHCAHRPRKPDKHSKTSGLAHGRGFLTGLLPKTLSLTGRGLISGLGAVLFCSSDFSFMKIPIPAGKTQTYQYASTYPQTSSITSPESPPTCCCFWSRQGIQHGTCFTSPASSRSSSSSPGNRPINRKETNGCCRICLVSKRTCLQVKTGLTWYQGQR